MQQVKEDIVVSMHMTCTKDVDSVDVLSYSIEGHKVYNLRTASNLLRQTVPDDWIPPKEHLAPLRAYRACDRPSDLNWKNFLVVQ